MGWKNEKNVKRNFFAIQFNPFQSIPSVEKSAYDTSNRETGHFLFKLTFPNDE